MSKVGKATTASAKATDFTRVSLTLLAMTLVLNRNLQMILFPYSYDMFTDAIAVYQVTFHPCLLYTSPSPRD